MSLDALRQLTGLDVDQGLINCMDDEGLFLSVVGMYIDQIKEYLPALTEHFDNKNFDEYGKLAHSIKGASASVGTHVIQGLSLDLEQAAKQQDGALIEAKHQEYYQLLVQTIDDLSASIWLWPRLLRG